MTMVYILNLFIVNLVLIKGCFCMNNYKVTDWGQTCAIKKEFTFRILIDQSVNSCVKECESRLKCEGIVFWSKLNICDLLDSHVINDVTGRSGSNQCIYVDRKDMVSTSGAEPCNGQCGDNAVCNQDASTCSTKECAPPVAILGRMLGNSYALGSSCVEHVSHVCNLHITCLSTGQWTDRDTQACDILVFRGVTGNGVDPYLAWEGRAPAQSRGTREHYRNPIVDVWDTKDIKEVRFAMYTNNTEVAYVVFNGTGTDKLNWFNKNNILRSSWNNMDKQSQYNYFSLVGHPPGRRMFISVFYKGCQEDTMYMVTIVPPVFSCPVENQPSQVYPTYLYANSTTAGLLKDAVTADYIEIFIRT